MSTYNIHQPHYGYEFVSAAIEGAGDLLHGLAKRIRREVVARKAIAELNAMNDQALSELGITRGEIETVVRTGRKG
ncbi:MAG: DUF1127 domain-containing protein [Arenibacter algicola]|nr:DUF1127 domain-containing protein [Arenibacter algicola]